MDSLTREERHVLRDIQDYLRATRVETGTVIEQAWERRRRGPSLPFDPDLNCVMPTEA